jgi:homoaconitate hydratase
MGRTVVEKIARAHMTRGPVDRPLRPGDIVFVRPHRVMTHDNTAAVMRKFADIGATRVHDPGQPVVVLDHDIQNTEPAHVDRYRSIEAFAADHGIEFHPAGRGIGHQVMIEELHVLPGALVVASDSHANMYGALGALGTPVVRTDAAAIWATGSFWWEIPRTVQVVLDGELPPGSTGKDVILTLCGLYRDEVSNAAVEFSGPGVSSLTLEERLTIANSTTEWGALSGWFPADAAALDFLRSRREAVHRSNSARVSDDDLRRWAEEPPGPDADASYAGRIELDLSQVAPRVAGPDAVATVTPLAELDDEGIAIDKAYLVSCVNSRAEDLAAAAAVLRGRRVAAGVELYVAAASREVQLDAQRTGDWQALLDAGARPLPPGCGPCIGLGAGLLEPGEVGISATNRNFKGRMGSPDATCYLASPAVVAASAVAGRITGPTTPDVDAPVRRFETLETGQHHTRPAAASSPGERLEGRLVFVPDDDVNTDAIFGAEQVYREEITKRELAAVVFRKYDAGLAARLRPGDVLVAGARFGSGSSREQAVTALQAAGIQAVVAASYSRTYLRNALNCGFPALVCPGLVDRLRGFLGRCDDGGSRTTIPGDDLLVDLAAARIEYRSETFAFRPLDELARGLLADGGIVKRIRRELGLEAS